MKKNTQVNLLLIKNYPYKIACPYLESYHGRSLNLYESRVAKGNSVIYYGCPDIHSKPNKIAFSDKSRIDTDASHFLFGY